MKYLHLFALSLACLSMQAQSSSKLAGGIQADVQDIAKERDSQELVNQLDDERQTLAAEYRAVLAQLESARIYNAQMEKIVASQESEKSEFSTQLEQLGQTQRELIPLMLSMIDTLDKFVKTDTPFLPQERPKRVEQLRSLMDRGDVSISEKYRRVLEAYQIELDYARTLETYSGKSSLKGSERIFDFLRFGRLALFAKTPDDQLMLQWSPAENDWVEINDGSVQREVIRGFRLAAKQAAPSLLQIPVPAAQDAQ